MTRSQVSVHPCLVTNIAIVSALLVANGNRSAYCEGSPLVAVSMFFPHDTIQLCLYVTRSLTVSPLVVMVCVCVIV